MAKLNLDRILRRVRTNAGDGLLLCAQIEREHLEFMSMLRRNAVKSKAGSMCRLAYIKAMHQCMVEHTNLLLSLGFVNKHLGLQTVESYAFRSYVGLGGSTRAYDVNTPPPFTEGEFPLDPELRQLAE